MSNESQASSSSLTASKDPSHPNSQGRPVATRERSQTLTARDDDEREDGGSSSILTSRKRAATESTDSDQASKKGKAADKGVTDQPTGGEVTAEQAQSSDQDRFDPRPAGQEDEIQKIMSEVEQVVRKGIGRVVATPQARTSELEKHLKQAEEAADTFREFNKKLLETLMTDPGFYDRVDRGAEVEEITFERDRLDDEVSMLRVKMKNVKSKLNELISLLDGPRS